MKVSALSSQFCSLTELAILIKIYILSNHIYLVQVFLPERAKGEQEREDDE
jgi:hypothetical protein